MEDTITLSAIEKKEVVCVATGERLGYVCDAEIERDTGRILFFVVPCPRDPFSFKACEYKRFLFSDICRIGEDIILVNCAHSCPPKPQKPKKVL